MRPNGKDNLLLALFALLAAGSVGLKAAAGPPRDGSVNSHPLQLEQQLVAMLQAQGFSATVRPAVRRSAIVLAERGACRLSVRSARKGAAYKAVFAADARAIGPVAYLYRGTSYDSPPAVAMRLGRFQTELLRSVGVATDAYIPVALARSPGCGSATFGLEDVRLS